jgi:hypothetical protein
VIELKRARRFRLLVHITEVRIAADIDFAKERFANRVDRVLLRLGLVFELLFGRGLRELLLERVDACEEPRHGRLLRGHLGAKLGELVLLRRRGIREYEECRQGECPLFHN